jgi:hypothetical protein
MNKTLRTKIASSLMLATGLAFAFVSCRNDQEIPDGGYSYFPNEIGHYCVYEVDSAIYDDFEHDTDYFRYQVKEIVESYFTDNQGREAMRVERYKRPFIDSIPYSQLPWTISRVWTFVRTASQGEKVEENERFLRLTFVPREGKEWDGNAFNTIGEWQYEYEYVDMPYSINTFSFDSTLQVIQKNETNLLKRRFYSEKYARHVGMIEKNVIDVSGQPDTLIIGIPVVDRIYSGVIYNIKLVDWGPR